MRTNPITMAIHWHFLTFKLNTSKKKAFFKKKVSISLEPDSIMYIYYFLWFLFVHLSAYFIFVCICIHTYMGGEPVYQLIKTKVAGASGDDEIRKALTPGISCWDMRWARSGRYRRGWKAGMWGWERTRGGEGVHRTSSSNSWEPDEGQTGWLSGAMKGREGEERGS